MIFKNKCLRCEKAEAFTKGKFLSAWCPKCHKEKFGTTHEERRRQMISEGYLYAIKNPIK